MFTSVKQRLILGAFVVVILSIPIGAYILSEQKNNEPVNTPISETQTITSSKPITSAQPSPSAPKLNLTSLLDTSTLTEPTPTTEPVNTTADSFGPTLNFLVTIEGRPLSNQAGKLFVGITDDSGTNPQYLLSFNIDVPASGSFTGLSLAGLTVGQQYHAYIKGPAQIATSSAFLMATNVSTLNDIQAITLTTGDLNEDNTINSADYAIAKSLYNTTENSSNWNPNVDLNKDGVINAADLLIITNNIGKTGASGVWQSTPRQGFASTITYPTPLGMTQTLATNSASPSGSPNSQGYWMWIPK